MRLARQARPFSPLLLAAGGLIAYGLHPHDALAQWAAAISVVLGASGTLVFWRWARADGWAASDDENDDEDSRWGWLAPVLIGAIAGAVFPLARQHGLSTAITLGTDAAFSVSSVGLLFSRRSRSAGFAVMLPQDD